MQGNPNTGSRGAKWLKLLLKIAVTVACLYYVFSKIDFSQAWTAIKKAGWGWLATALFAYYLSKIIGSRRLAIYFRNIGIHLREWQYLKLYLLGMFYNLFLPGAITGDAYKVVLLSKRFGTSYKKTTAAVLLDRFSGLLSLGLIVTFYSCFVLKEKWMIILLGAGALLAIPFVYFIIKRFFPDFLQSFWSTFFLGTLVQFCVLLCVYFILFALRTPGNLNGYVFIFLIAALASVLPISVGGGLGVREFVIIEAARYAGLDQHTALILSLLFYFVTVVCSLTGMVFVFRDPLSPKKIPAN